MFGTTALAVDDLKIYSSELNKFSLQMPSGWEMIEQKKKMLQIR